MTSRLALGIAPSGHEGTTTVCILMNWTRVERLEAWRRLGGGAYRRGEKCNQVGKGLRYESGDSMDLAHLMIMGTLIGTAMATTTAKMKLPLTALKDESGVAS